MKTQEKAWDQQDVGDGASRRSELQSREGASEHIHSDSENEGDEEPSKRERQVHAGDRERLPTQNWSLQSSELLRQELTPYANRNVVFQGRSHGHRPRDVRAGDSQPLLHAAVGRREPNPNPNP